MRSAAVIKKLKSSKNNNTQSLSNTAISTAAPTSSPLDSCSDWIDHLQMFLKLPSGHTYGISYLPSSSYPSTGCNQLAQELINEFKAERPHTFVCSGGQHKFLDNFNCEQKYQTNNKNSSITLESCDPDFIPGIAEGDSMANFITDNCNGSSNNNTLALGLGIGGAALLLFILGFLLRNKFKSRRDQVILNNTLEANDPFISEERSSSVSTLPTMGVGQLFNSKTASSQSKEINAPYSSVQKSNASSMSQI